MRVFVDTTVWSLALRRKAERLSRAEQDIVVEWEELIREGRVVLTGVVRQEVLSGIRREVDFERLRTRLLDFEDTAVDREDYEHAARLFNVCRAKGVAGSTVDLLICALADRRQMSVFTTDPDFALYARHVPLKLHKPRA